MNTLPMLALLLAAVTAAVDPISLRRDLDEAFGEAARTRAAAPEPALRPGHGTVVWLDRTVDDEPRIVEFDPDSGETGTLIDDIAIAAAWSAETPPPSLTDPVWRSDGDAVIFVDAGSVFHWSFAEERLTRLDVSPGPFEYVTFAPDGRRIAWVRDNDLFVYDIETECEIRLTDDGSATVYNGVFDWVYTEELAGRDGRAYRWSDDGSAIAWLRLDDDAIPVFHLPDLLGTHSRITGQRYPKPGDSSPTPTLLAASFDDEGGVASRWRRSFNGPPPYIPRFGFTPDNRVWFQQLDRAQERLQLIVVDSAGDERVRIDESDPAWIEPVDGVRFLSDGAVLWLSRRSGFTHLLRVDRDGAAVDLTPQPWDVIELIGISADGRTGWVTAAAPSPLHRRIMAVDLVTGGATALTPADGTHSATHDPATGALLVTHSAADTPPHWTVFSTRDGHVVSAVPAEVETLRIAIPEIRRLIIETNDGLELNAEILLPPGFDEHRRYPVVVFTYGGPHAQVVRDRWPSTTGIFNRILADAGFVVFAVDNRGSTGRGRDFETVIDRALGSSQLGDQLAGVEWLQRQPWVDPDRIGIWGWSYGGYMTAYALTRAPGVFACGVAVAPVTDWRLYDSVYTERYMGAPEDNPVGYGAGSVLDGVAALADPLLVIHGTGDDNVHFQHTIQLADRAWRAGKRFDLRIFPGLGHSIDAGGARRRVFGDIAAFLLTHLAPDTEPFTESAADGL